MNPTLTTLAALTLTTLTLAVGGTGVGRKEWRIPQADLDNYLGEQ